MDPAALAAMPSNPNEDKGPLIAAVVSVFLALIIVSMSLRIYVRGTIQVKWSWDDNLMTVAAVLYMALSGLIFWGVKQGMGKHVLDLQLDAISRAILAWFISEILYSFCITMVKVSIGIFLLRIAVKRVHRIVLIVTTVINFGMGVTFLGFVVFQCKPINYFWLRALNDNRPGHCTNTIGPIDLVYVYSAVNVIVDLTYAVLPALMVWDLQMPWRTKAMVAALLSMGTVGSMGLLIRIPYLASLGSNLDFLYNTTNVAIWSIAEPGLGIVAGNLATLRPLLLALQGRRAIRKSRSTGSGLPRTHPGSRPEGLRRAYLSHSRRLGSDEEALGATATRDTFTPGSGDLSLEKLDLEGKSRMGIGMMTTVSVGGPTRWSMLPFPEANGWDGEEEGELEMESITEGGKENGGAAVKVVVRQSFSRAAIANPNLDDEAGNLGNKAGQAS